MFTNVNHRYSHIILIIIPNIFNYPFTYESDLKLQIGDFVEVPFGKSKSIGVVWNEFEKKNNKNFKIKEIIRKLEVPSLKKDTLRLFDIDKEINVIPNFIDIGCDLKKL